MSGISRTQIVCGTSQRRHVATSVILKILYSHLWSQLIEKRHDIRIVVEDQSLSFQ